MFHFGLAGGFKPGLQHSVTSGFPSAFPKRQGGAYPQPEFAFCSLPSVCRGLQAFGGNMNNGPGVAQDFYSSGPHQSKGPGLSSHHLDFW